MIIHPSARVRLIAHGETLVSAPRIVNHGHDPNRVARYSELRLLHRTRHA